MGGTVAVTLREPDGKEHRMYRWTNPLPGFVECIHLINKDPEYIQSYLRLWFEMAEDWKKHKEDEKFEFPMTACYAPYPGLLAPEGYGLVVLDMQKDKILSMQGYSSFGKMDEAALFLSMSPNVFTGDSDEHAPHRRFAELFKAGRVKGRYSYEGKEVPQGEANVEDLLKAIRKRKSSDWVYYELDLSPFTIEDFGDFSDQHASNFKARLIELGFELTDKENDIWDAWIEAYNE